MEEGREGGSCSQQTAVATRAGSEPTVEGPSGSTKPAGQQHPRGWEKQAHSY